MLQNKKSGKTISLSNLIDHQPDIDKIYLYAKNLYEAKYQLLINKRKKTGIHIWMTLKLLSDTQMIWMIMKIWKNTIQTRNSKY